jgi:hypothetical protein
MNDNVKVLTLSKKINKQIVREKKQTKRVVSEKWEFSEECYNHLYQFGLINDINDKIENHTKVCKTVIQEINKKIYSYKQQDIIKNKYNIEKFITFENVVNKLVESKLKCYYCKENIFVLYDIARECKQWSIDRINNSLGHNNDNYYIACLECNLKRRCTRDDKFLFTKQMKIIKEDNLV